MPRALIVGLLAGVAAVVIWWAVSKRNEDERVIIPPETQARIDSLEETARAAGLLRDSLDHLADSVKSLGRTLRTATNVPRAVASSRGVTADSAARLARLAESAKDSAALWQSAYIARTEQADSLESVVAKMDQAAREDSIAITALTSGWHLDVERLHATELVVRDLRVAIDKANECRILGLIDCPTRTQAFIGGAIVAAVTVRYGGDIVRAVRP